MSRKSKIRRERKNAAKAEQRAAIRQRMSDRLKSGDLFSKRDITSCAKFYESVMLSNTQCLKQVAAANSIVEWHRGNLDKISDEALRAKFAKCFDALFEIVGYLDNQINSVLLSCAKIEDTSDNYSKMTEIVAQLGKVRYIADTETLMRHSIIKITNKFASVVENKEIDDDFEIVSLDEIVRRREDVDTLSSHMATLVETLNAARNVAESSDATNSAIEAITDITRGLNESIENAIPEETEDTPQTQTPVGDKTAEVAMGTSEYVVVAENEDMIHTTSV